MVCLSTQLVPLICTKNKLLPNLLHCRMNYKDYSMESRLHFRIHAALSSMGHPVEGTMQQQHVSLPAPSL